MAQGAEQGNTILIDIKSNGVTTLKTEGKYCKGDVELYVDVPIPSGYIKPSGNKTITTNGTHDVKNYANAVVNVLQPTYETWVFTMDDGTTIEKRVGVE